MQRIKQFCRASRCTFHSHFAAKSLAIWLASSATAAATAFVQVIALATASITGFLPVSYAKLALKGATRGEGAPTGAAGRCSAQEIGRNSILMRRHLNFARIIILKFTNMQEREKERERESAMIFESLLYLLLAGVQVSSYRVFV